MGLAMLALAALDDSLALSIWAAEEVRDVLELVRRALVA